MPIIQYPPFVKMACNQFPKKIMVSIDARNGLVAIKGWVEISSQTAVDLAKTLEPMGVSGFIYTDIGRDGMMQGPNIESIVNFVKNTSLPVIVAGGVSRLEDIADLLPLESEGVTGIIVGKALYDKRVDYKEARDLAAKYAG